MRIMKLWTVAMAAGALVLAAGCGDDDPKPTTDTSVTDTSTDATDTSTTDTEDPTDTESDTTGPGTFATLVFTITDTNQTYDASDGLAWKGSFAYDADTNIAAFDGSWGGPFPMLRDDGMEGDAVADDGVWTASVLVATPEEDLTFEYGAIRGSVDGSDGAWIWIGDNGTVTVPADETGTVTATGLVIPAHGTIDLMLTIDVSNDGANLDPLFQGSGYTDVKVKGSAWGWVEVVMVDDGTMGDETAADGIYTFKLSENLAKHDGLLLPGAVAQFVFVLDGVEYKADGAPPATGVTAALDFGDGFVAATIENQPEGDKNTFVSVPEAGFDPPAGHVAVNFTIDDSANKTYEWGDGLAWKGSFDYDATTRVLALDGSWGGPYPMMYDDGPWNEGGHEPAGAVAGDNIWGVTVWVDNSAETAFEYGAIRDSVDGSDGAWIWTGDNGSFTVTAGATEAIDAAGLVIAAHGEIDMQLTIDVSSDGASLATNFQGLDYTGKVKVKGSAWGWAEIVMNDDGMAGDATSGDGIYTFVLSEKKGKHDGLLKSGDTAQFVFVLDGVEYKADGAAASEAVAAAVDSGGGWTPVTVMTQDAGDKNTYITAP